MTAKRNITGIEKLFQWYNYITGVLKLIVLFGATSVLTEICDSGWFWEARKICCSCCRNTDNTGGNVHITRSLQQFDPCWYILIII